jgi:hypothetical protein
VTAQSHEIETKTGVAKPARVNDPFHNPSYPRRDHFAERAQLEGVLSSCEERVQAAQKKLESSGDRAGKPDSIRLFHQLLGVRDQLAECVRRIPLETGELYEEDKERFNQAAAALERVWQRWEKTA